MKEREYFILSVNHCAKHNKFILMFRPNDSGYANRLHVAGRYPEQRVKSSLGYYNSGCSAIAVPCDVMESMAVPAPEGHFDTPGGVVVLNNAKNWREAIANAVEKPAFEPKPEYKGKRRGGY
ncbi:hypothetical protein RDT67_25260 [Serratia fonticola]|uniref:Uncharacterized protein n=1 Tax=Serratia fonticola TaxID=47917 RepID=A0AAJ2DEQ4_SERFO|nr:hypothetical protein [Serratia fonticola]MDQ9129730.1 hypothetical protein [Serratia fonticola]